MKTPKQEAEYLVNLFSAVGLQQRDEGKACALICVDIILDAIDWHEFETPNKEISHYQEVKSEIETI